MDKSKTKKRQHTQTTGLVYWRDRSCLKDRDGINVTGIYFKTVPTFNGRGKRNTEIEWCGWPLICKGPGYEGNTEGSGNETIG